MYMKDHLMKCMVQLVCFFGVISTSFGALDLIDLGTLGGTESFAYAINDSGQVIGVADLAGDKQSHVFLYDKGNLVDLTAIYDIESANDINEIGQIVGNMPNGHSGLLSGGVITDLGTFGGIFSSPLGINNLGQIVGYYSSPEFFNHAILYSNGVVTNLGPFDDEAISIATAINDSGMIIGDATHSFTIPYHAFLYSNGVMTDISPFGSSESYARDISNSGQVVGEFLLERDMSFHAFLYSNGAFADLGVQGSPDTTAYAINDHDQVVGTTFVPFEDICVDPKTGEEYPCTHYKPHAFLYEKGEIIDLNTLVDRAKPIYEWELTQALDINNKGQIVGYGLVNGKNRAFLITLPKTLQRLR